MNKRQSFPTATLLNSLPFWIIAAGIMVGHCAPPLAHAQSTTEVLAGDSLGLVPLTELGATTYKGHAGGLYGSGNNRPPQSLAALADQQLKAMKPLGPDGQPAVDGKIVLISIGMSNTTMEFSAFKTTADASALKSSQVLIVDTAQGGRTASAWANSRRAGSRSQSKGTVWDEADYRIKAAGGTPHQVQAVWIKLAGSTRADWFEPYKTDLRKTVHLAKSRYPNLRIAYLSSRIYAGYATTDLNPEPWSYETAFAVQQIILEQTTPEAQSRVQNNQMPLMLWGPYLWADGITPRSSDGLTWLRKDFAADGTHPHTSGKAKVAGLLTDFFTTSPYAKGWFCKAR